MSKKINVKGNNITFGPVGGDIHDLSLQTTTNYIGKSSIEKANIPHNLGTNTTADNDDNKGTISAQNTNKTDVVLCALEGCSNLANKDFMCIET